MIGLLVRRKRDDVSLITVRLRVFTCKLCDDGCQIIYLLVMTAYDLTTA